RKMDAAGGRLTPDGWHRAAKYFVKPERPPRNYAIGVMYGEEIYDTRIDGVTAEVWLTRGALGQIDFSARFTSVTAPELLDPRSGRPWKRKDFGPVYGPTRIDPIYNLRLTDTHWEFGGSGDALRQVKGNPEWRLTYFEYEPWV